MNINPRKPPSTTSRAMLENTRQGFWNGSRPPFGYRTYIAERRGKKDKKKLEIAPQEAEVVKMIFRHYVTGDGKSGPMGLRAIAYDLNERGETTRKGGKFLQQFIQRLLTNEIYVGRYHFNKKDKDGIAKPEDKWVFLKTPRSLVMKYFMRPMNDCAATRPFPRRGLSMAQPC